MGGRGSAAWGAAYAAAPVEAIAAASSSRRISLHYTGADRGAPVTFAHPRQIFIVIVVRLKADMTYRRRWHESTQVARDRCKRNRWIARARPDRRAGAQSLDRGRRLGRGARVR